MKTLKNITLILLALLSHNSAISMDTAVETENFLAGEPFARVVNKTLQLANKTYLSPTYGKVTLLSTQHYAKKDFYDQHNTLLEQASKVLYEGKGMNREGLVFFKSPTGLAQQRLSHPYHAIAEAYGVCVQFDCINYEQSHFVHADYSLEEVALNEGQKSKEQMMALIEENIRSINEKYKLWAKEAGLKDGCAFVHMMNVQKQKATSAKENFEQFASFSSMSRDDIESLLRKESELLFTKEIINRNRIVFTKLADALTKDADFNAHLIIYYGAGHMPYFEEELIQKYGFIPHSVQWISSVSF